MGAAMIRSRQVRNRWLVGSSALAAAAALVMGPATAQAEALAAQISIEPPVLADTYRAAGPAAQQTAPTIMQSVPGVTSVTAPVVSTITTLSSTTAPSNGDTNTAGINVLASANYFASDINYTPGSTSDVVNVLTSGAIINWTTNKAGTAGGEVVFMGTGSRLDFTSNLIDYSVLNRIYTPGVDAAVRIDGIVNSSAISGSPGGQIWFYSPGGLIIGASSSFNVGSLVLTSSNPDTIGSVGSAWSFNGAADPASAVKIESGARINADKAQNAYLAVVSPRIEQGGNVIVNGSIAYVAAEQAQLTINNGLFDISVGVGSADANGVVHTGTTTGSASSPTVDALGTIIDANAHGIYMVAVPKNTAITMLVGGTVGYLPAAAASLAPNGSIILSAGAGTSVSGTAASPIVTVDSVNAVSGANIAVADAQLNSSTSIYASGSADLSQSGFGGLVVGSDARDNYDLDVTAGNSVTLGIADYSGISVAGDLTVRAGQSAAVTLNSVSPPPLGNPPPGGGVLSVGGNFTIDTSAAGADDFFTVRNNGNTGIGGDAAAGSISLDIGGVSALSVGNSLTLKASAQGGKGELQNGSGTGGNITVNLTSGSVAIGGSLLLSADVAAAQAGKIGGNGPGAIGSDSSAGNIALNVSGGSLSAAVVSLSASAEASAGSNSGIAQSNDAAAGAVTVNMTGGNVQAGSFGAYARANAANAFDASGNALQGAVKSGSVDIAVSNTDSLLNITTGANIDVSTSGIVTPPSGNAVSISAANTGSNGGIAISGTVQITAATSYGSDTALNIAGSVLVSADNGNVTFGDLYIDAFGSPNGDPYNASGSSGSSYQGGDITLHAANGGSVAGNSVYLNAQGLGSDGSGGDAFGGMINVGATDGQITLNYTTMLADAVGGSGPKPLAPGLAAAARGGTIALSVSGAAGLLDLGYVDAEVNGAVQNSSDSPLPPFAGNGGTAAGGSVSVNVDGGVFNAVLLYVAADGFGGDGGLLATNPAIAASGNLALLDAPELFGLTAFSGQPTAYAPSYIGGAIAAVSGGPAGTGLPTAGAGGTGTGGTLVYNLNGGTSTIGDLTVSADGVGGYGGYGDFTSGTAGGAGGDSFGGSATFNAFAGTLNLTGKLTVSAQGNPSSNGGAGGFSYGSEGGPGGNGTGGNATFNLVGSAAINAGSVLVSADGFGGRGGSSFATFDALSNPIPARGAGDGGDGTGGIAVFNNTSGSLAATLTTISARGLGGNGGNTDEAAGSGGSGIGGSATLNLNQDDNSDPGYTVTAAGLGGSGGSGLLSGFGGNAIGGDATLAINNAVISLDNAAIDAVATGGIAGQVTVTGGTAGLGGTAQGGTANLELNGGAASLSSTFALVVSADATGGAGAGGSLGDGVTAGGIGGFGGNAIGGTARLALSGAGTSLTMTPALVSLSASGAGGAGGAGGDNLVGGAAGTGGIGGNGTGGTTLIEANSGTTVTLDGLGRPFGIYSSGTGGSGGAGGNIDMAAGGTAGTGGTGGNGSGGSPTLRAIGGTISGAAVQSDATGFGGTGGAGGSDGLTTSGTLGDGGNGAGGTPLFELLNGSPGIISLGDLTVTANGVAGTGTISGIDASGLVTFRDLSTTVGGVFSFGSLTVDATNFAAGPIGGGLVFIAGSGTNNVAGNMVVNVTGDISYVFDGNAQIAVGGATTLNATGAISVTHTNNALPTISLDIAGNFYANAGGNFTAGPGSIIRAGGELFVTAGGDLSADDLRAAPVIALTAAGNVFLNNAAASGPQGLSNLGGIIIDAGLAAFASVPVYDPLTTATLTGSVTSYSDITIRAGGSAIFNPSANVAADNALLVQTGDDIIVQSGAVLSSANNPAASINLAAPFASGPNLALQSGAITSLNGPIATPISSLVTTGALNANGGAVILTANAIDGLGGTITASSLSADIIDAPAAGLPQSSDAGLLGAACLAGNICFGSLSADNRIEIGQNSNNDVIQLIAQQAAIAANDVLITTRNDIVMGTNGFPSAISATNTFALQSLTGNVDLRDAAITSNQITVQAAGSLQGNGLLTSANDIGITVGQDLTALLIDTGGQLTNVATIGGAREASYSVPGGLNIGTLSQGSGDVNLIAGGNLTIGTAQIAGAGNIALAAGSAGAGDVFLGTAANAGSIALSGDNAGFTALSPAGDVTMTANQSISGLTIDAGGNVALTAGTTVVITDVTAAQTGTGLVTITGNGGVTLGTLTGNQGSLFAVTGPVLITSDINMTGLLSAGGTAVQLVSSNDLTVSAASTAGPVDLTTTGNLTVNDANASGILTMTVGGAASFIGNATGTIINLTSADIAIGAGGSLGQSAVTTAITLSASGDMTLGGLGAAASGYTLDNAEFGRIFSGGDVSISAPASAAGGGNILLDTLDASVGNAAAGQSGTVGPNGALYFAADGAINVVGAVTLSRAGAGNLLALDAANSIHLDTAGGLLQVIGANGALAGELDLTAPVIDALSATARTEVAGLGTAAALDTRLGVNDGVLSDAGFFVADTISFNVADALLIQNSGLSSAIADRRGLTGNTVNVSSANPAVTIIINGVVGTATGFDALLGTGIPAAFDPGSTINGCLILYTAGCFNGTLPPGSKNPIKDLIDEIIDPTDGDPEGGGPNGRGPDGGIDFSSMLVTMRGNDRLAQDPLLDDPVTGAGNEDLWIASAACSDADPAAGQCTAPSESEPPTQK